MNQRPRINFRRSFTQQFQFVRKYGLGYDRDNFSVMVTAVDRYQTQKEYKRSIILARGL